MNVDTDVFDALAERAAAVDQLRETVAELARRVEQVISFDAMMTRARNGGYEPAHAAPKRARHLKVVR